MLQYKNSQLKKNHPEFCAEGSTCKSDLRKFWNNQKSTVLIFSFFFPQKTSL